MGELHVEVAGEACYHDLRIGHDEENEALLILLFYSMRTAQTKLAHRDMSRDEFGINYEKSATTATFYGCLLRADQNKNLFCTRCCKVHTFKN